jgi:periplasmic divalent cation tolerance protein
LVTVPDAETGERLARALVAEGLAACVNLLPSVRSFYVWKGEMRDDAELLLVIKTSATRVDELIARVLAMHPYDVPEVLALPVDTGSPDYVAWVREACEKREGA